MLCFVDILTGRSRSEIHYGLHCLLRCPLLPCCVSCAVVYRFSVQLTRQELITDIHTYWCFLLHFIKSLTDWYSGCFASILDGSNLLMLPLRLRQSWVIWQRNFCLSLFADTCISCLS